MASAEKFIQKVIESRRLGQNFLSEEIWREPSEMPSYSDAVEKIEKTIHRGGKTLVWGDQDCDGITSAALLHLALESSGADVRTYIPDRKKEGIGMNVESLEKEIKTSKPSLVITVDCCSRDTRAASILKNSGIDLVVTDHHEIPFSFIDGRTIVNCRREDSAYPFDGLSGSGVALKIALRFSHDPYLWVLSALGTISDRVPLLDENRSIVKRCLSILKKFRFESIDLLCSVQESPLPENVEDLKKIVISPISSDVSENGDSTSFFFLTKKIHRDHAQKMVNRSRDWNENREKYWSKALKIKKTAGPFILIRDGEIPRGILGSIASRLSITEGKKVFALGALDDCGFETIEARASEGNALEVLEKNSHLFETYGGHKKACGAKIKNSNVEEFVRNITELPEETFSARKLRIDFSAAKNEMNDEVLIALSSFGPFGQDFPDISIQIPDLASSSPLDGKNIYMLNEKAKLREATAFDDVWITR
ncbi:DHH family phosphoesterase [candidate division WOR-3 bacterium]|nr:DHH family phosphoesterase [candidate division WOR-3 bacterium]